MNFAVLTMVLALIWAAITGSFSGLNLLLGAAIGFLALFLLRDFVSEPKALGKLSRIASLLALFLTELVKSAFSVALIVVTPNIRSKLRPAIIAVPLTVTSDAEITLLANLITLTPGTLSIDVSPDRQVLYVHALMLDSREALIADIASGFEAKVKEVFA